MGARADLAQHMTEMHPRIRQPKSATSARLARLHARWHWQNYSSHYHRHDPATGPPSPDNRPAGWYSGADAVMKS